MDYGKMDEVSGRDLEAEEVGDADVVNLREEYSMGMSDDCSQILLKTFQITHQSLRSKLY